MKNVSRISETHRLDETAIKYTVDFKRNLITEFDQSFSFFSSGKYVIAHPSDTNPCQYGVAFLQGNSLRDDIAESFGKLIKWKVCKHNEDTVGWPVLLEQLIHLLNKGPLPELYVIYYTILMIQRKINLDIMLRLHQTKLSEFGQ